LTYLENSGPEGQISSYDYTLGPAGNRKKIVEHNGDVCEYEYDKLYRLTRESRTGDNAYWIEYTYDAFGNRLEMNAGGVTTTYTYDKNDRLQSESGPNGITSYTWDLNGNMIGKSGPDPDSGQQVEWTYDWNHDNKMARAEKGGALVSAYAYDFRGERINKTTSTDETAFLIDNNNQTGYSQALRETGPSNEEKVSYTFGDDLVSQEKEEISFLHYDGLGSTRYLTSEKSHILDSITYSAFGSLLNENIDYNTNYLFSGEYYDDSIKSYYLRSRYYSASSNIFISADTFEGIRFDPFSLHKYLYAHNNPVNLTDPTGKFTIAEMLITLAIQEVIDMVMGHLSTPKEHRGEAGWTKKDFLRKLKITLSKRFPEFSNSCLAATVQFIDILPWQLLFVSKKVRS